MGDDGKWLNKVSDPYEAALLYVPQGVEMGGGGSPSKNWLDTAGWPEPIANVQCTIYIIIVVKCHQNMFRYVLYQINKLKLNYNSVIIESTVAGQREDRRM